MHFKWSGIEEFVKVAELGSFSQAAKSLNVSKSHISKHIKNLENQFSVVLFHRTTRNVTLTNQGKYFFLKCQKILSNLEDAQGELIDEASELIGSIKIAVAGAFGEDIIAPVIASFLRQYPDVSIEMEFTNRIVNIPEEHFDLAIRTEFTDLENFIAEEIYQYDLITVARPDFIDKSPEIRTPDDLQKINCLMGTIPYWRFNVDNKNKEIVVDGNWQSNNGRALVSAANSGMGIIQVPIFYVTNELTSGKLISILDDYALKNIKYYAVMSKLNYVPRRVNTLIKFLKETLEKDKK